MRENTYIPPSRNTLYSMSFSCNLSCSLKTSRIGSASTTTSVEIFSTAFANQKSELSMHVPSMFLFHDRSSGTHWKIVANTVAIPELMTIVSAP